MSAGVPADIRKRQEALADQLAAESDLTEWWRAALMGVPRHLFVPDRAWAMPDGPGDSYAVDKAADPDRWWDAVYSDTILVTQRGDGAHDTSDEDAPTSSSNSAPGAVFNFLGWLKLWEHHRVLDVGTGTGWTAALLSHRVGDGNVTSIEIDPELSEQASESLAAAGYKPDLVVGDATAGALGEAPFDRVHATCAVSRVPYAWVEQTRPGGIILTPLRTGYGYGHLVRLHVLGDGRAIGRFVGFAGFMMLRSQRDGVGSDDEPPGEPERSTTRLDPRTVAWDSYAADLAIGAIVPGCSEYLDIDDETGAATFELSHLTSGSWAGVEYQPDSDEYAVRQHGPRRLWDEVAAAYRWWLDAGRPERDRFGLTVTPEGQYVWLDTPDREVTP